MLRVSHLRRFTGSYVSGVSSRCSADGRLFTARAMRAVIVKEPGGPDVMEVRVDVALPDLRPGEVLLRTAATAVNRADVMQRQGSYPPPKGASAILGLECSGTIESIGEGVEGWQVGQKVCALLAGGGYAEKVAVPAGQLLPLPHIASSSSDLSLLQAAALPEAACTVWSAVFMPPCQLTQGQTFLVHGGSSGIGTFAIQLARCRGARVFCTAGTAEKVHRCRELGADVAINYREEDFVERVKEETNGRGVDVILDIMGGGDYLPRNLRSLAEDGRMFVLGLQGGRVGEVDVGRMLVKRLTLASAGLRSRPLDQKREIVRQVREHVWPLIEKGAVSPVVNCVLPLNKVVDAHRLLESSAHIGKIVLQVY